MKRLIRVRLLQMLRNEITLKQFYKWFSLKTWNCNKYGMRTLNKLVYGIDLAFAEYTSGHLTELDLRKRLVKFLASGINS